MKKLSFKHYVAAVSLLSMALLYGCASKEGSLPTADFVNLDEFMGRWYVHGYTPIIVDKEAHNAIEHYRLDEERKIQTTYQFRDGGFDGELKTYTPVGWVHDTETNAEWRMQFLWPFRSDYIVLYVDDAHSETIIAHPSRKYLWIMTRSTELSGPDYERLIALAEEAGYDRNILRRLPQDWSNEAERLKQLEVDGL